MSEILMVVISAFVGAIVAAIGAVIQSSLSTRAKIDESLRGDRIAQYRTLWKKTGLLPKWPKAEDITYPKLDALTKQLRDWYFDGGGICLSAQARKAYGEVQKMLNELLAKNAGNLSAELPPKTYDDLQECLSLLRTELTRDLLSRKRALFIAE